MHRETSTAGAAIAAAQPTSRRKLVCRRFLLLSLVVLLGCATVFPSYVGTPADPDNRLPLDGIGQASVWQTRDLAIHYAANREGRDFLIDGRIERLGPTRNFAAIDDLRITIHFIDAEGLILASHLLWSAGAGEDPRLMRWTFSRRYALPPETAAFGFSYRGSFSDVGSDMSGGGDWEIWKQP